MERRMFLSMLAAAAAVRETGFHPFTSTAYAAEGKPINVVNPEAVGKR